ncbi:MAG: Flp family type IVb pilin [Proteobacteria bacterium]|nr:Flp family type IVb pilin [Pseudomonadota bacterium]MDA1023730.1 Flp family type IVb pilin [Pseudomonadota bacterium]
MNAIDFWHHDNHLPLKSKPRKSEPVRKLAQRLKKEVKGATAIEYALIATLIFLVIVSAIGVLSTNTENMYNKISNAVTGNL